MKLTLPWTTLFLLFISCSGNVSEGVLDDNRMVLLMKDLQYARAATYGQRPEVKDSLMDVYKDQICEIHGLDRNMLEANLDALQNDPERLYRIYDLLENLLDSLGKQ